MKTIKNIFLVALLGVFLTGNSAFGQAEKKYFITVTKMHWNMNMENFSMDDWKAGEKEYLDKVVSKNQYILGQDVLMHYFTADNTEILFVTTYESWDAIEKASERSTELEKAAWPNESSRTTADKKRMSYYARNHSDEIYNSFPTAKNPKGKFDKPMLYYVRESVFAYPKDGTQEQFLDFQKKYLSEVVNKNDFVKAYYPNVHAWGADNTNFTEVFVVETLCDLEKSLDKNADLMKGSWNDKTKKDSYSTVMENYFTGVHRDYIYRSVPELAK